MAEAVAQGFSHEALRAMLACGGFHGCTDGFDEWAAAFDPGALALRWTGSARAQVFFYSVELADEAEDLCGIRVWAGFKHFDEVPTYVGEAGDEAYERIGFGVGFVNRVAVALDVAGKFSAYGFDKLVAAAPDSPVVEEAALRVVGDPQVSPR